MAFSPANFLLGLPGTVFGAIASTGDAPAITSDGGGATADVSVNTGDTAVTTVTATGTDTIQFSIVGGAEALMFEIDPDTGALAFTQTSVDGEYEVEVAAQSDWGTDTQLITVTVEEGGYHADAVHFDGVNSSLHINSLTVTDGPTGGFSFWLRQATEQTSVLYAVDPDTNYVTLGDFDAPQTLDLDFSDEDGSNNVGLVGDNDCIPVNVWHSVICAWKTDLGAGLKILKLYVDDMDVGNTIDDTGGAFTVAFNALAFFLGADGGGGGATFDLAEFWFAPGQSLLTGSDIAEATRQKFRSAAGKPVDLGADGSTPTGSAPAIFFSGDATGFITNKGTGGAFTLTGSLTNASTSPSD